MHKNSLYIVRVPFTPDEGYPFMKVYTILSPDGKEACTTCELEVQLNYNGKLGQSNATLVPIPVVASAYEVIKFKRLREHHTVHIKLTDLGMNVPVKQVLHCNQLQLHLFNQEKQNG